MLSKDMSKGLRIIGIQLYDTKWHTVNKILKSGWYPFGDYPAPKDDEPYFLPKRSEILEGLYDLHKDNPHIEVSCLVGMNGSGKSTLLDILYRLINNYAVTVLGDKMDNKHGRHLRYADGLNADLYYELEGKLYKIRCQGEQVDLLEQNANGLFGDSLTKKGDLTGFDHFFYTISNNYSLYSLNEKEYREEIKDGQTIDGHWVNGLFHKNDGYLSPIVITPFRENGSVNIEKENGLALQRIAAIAVLGAANGEPSILDGYRVKSIKYKINKHYKSKIKEKWQESWSKQIDDWEYFERVLSVFEDQWEEQLGMKLDAFDDVIIEGKKVIRPTKKDLILQYLAYKSFKICSTYDDYYTLFKMGDLVKKYNENKTNHSGINYGWEQRHKEEFQNVVKRLCNREKDSHINLKTRQCQGYVDGSVYTDEEGEVEIATLIKGKSVKTFDEAVLLLPPAFFDIDLVLEKEKGAGNDEDERPMTVATLSSGERQMLYTMSYVLYHVKNIQSVKPSENCHQYYHINLVFDEAELYYHPDYQKQFVKKLIDYIDRCNLDNKIIKSINVIIATHSPFVLTDILTQNTLYLYKGNPRTVERQTFGANYYDMLHDSFFFEETALGGVATKRIKEWLTETDENGEKVRVDKEEVAELVGDPLIGNYILSGVHVQD